VLAEPFGIVLYRVGSGGRMTFCEGEEVLFAWMGTNAFVCWTVTPEPWLLEAELIRSVNLPLNIDQNSGSPSLASVREARRTARQVARCAPVRA